MKYLIILFISLIAMPIYAVNYVSAKPKRGFGVEAFLKYYELSASEANIDRFKELNHSTLGSKLELSLTQTYKLPIQVYKFNGKSIRTTIGIKDYDLAKQIEKYNKDIQQKGIKKKVYNIDKVLWVPLELVNSKEEIAHKPQHKKNFINEPLLGKNYSYVEILNSKLDNCIFYLICGHGGPDPGAIGNKGGKELHEDEYAYDVIMRLGRKLIENGALVYFIVQDSADGIREGKFLAPSDKEIHLGGSKIPTDQLERLSSRVKIVNSLYETNLDSKIQQYAIEIHVDSRLENQNIDIFFYHKEGDKTGKKMADEIKNTIKRKYAKAQPGRGYEGTLSSRNLYMVRNLKPTTVFIEIGNIQNSRDQTRIMEPNNRQALANWINAGVLNFIK
ncbi:MAG TPA: N-acetylmuramoyl-L-alanine amidase [Candidatus Kapabacteria bacterium]|nr:N-acetylmuramoyl-L-alanine amidase [Candidatus Kapabacteria bacterium]